CQIPAGAAFNIAAEVLIPTTLPESYSIGVAVVYVPSSQNALDCAFAILGDDINLPIHKSFARIPKSNISTFLDNISVSLISLITLVGRSSIDRPAYGAVTRNAVEIEVI
ncbi:12631_t:CDS:2, partial [Entrophospora sp. SA101]